jgi:hypothetical protein
MQTLLKFQELKREGGIAVAFAREQSMMVSIETAFGLSAARTGRFKNTWSERALSYTFC